jgi:DNA-directed RNA polymerase beta' subunit
MIISAQNNAPVMGCVQNTLVCMYLITETFTTPEDSRATGVSQKNSKFFDDQTPAYETFIDEEDFKAALNVADIGFERFQDLLVRAKKFYPKYIKGDISNPSSLKLASKVPGKILASVVFPRTFTWSRKTDVNERMQVVKIKNGIILPESGPLCKKIIGGTSGSTVHALWKISPDTASRMISECQFISSVIISRIGFSMGISDTLPTKLGEVKASINEALIKCEMINSSDKDTYDKEREINGALNEAMSVAPRLAKTSMNKGDRNALVIMHKCGAKGSIANNGQISGFVGQQNIDGKRAPFMLSNGTRTLPHFDFGDNSPEARGFIKHSYIQGLSFKEVWFHAAAGRRGVIDTAMKSVTRETRIFLNLEGEFVNLEIGLMDF